MQACLNVLVVNSDQEERNRAVAEKSTGSEVSKAAKEGAGEKPDETWALDSNEI